VRTIHHWLSHYEQHHNVDDEHRSGRKRKTTPEEDQQIIDEAKETKFTTPRQIRRKLELHKKKFSEEEKQKRLTFANKYKDWTVEQWMKVIFSDEKIFWGEGFMGRVYVRRPVGEALNPEYCVDQNPHPVKVNVWGCLCGKGLGYMYIFNEKLNAKLLQEILGTHLLDSAKLHYDIIHAEGWWFLQDNDPKHKSGLIQAWLFNHGIQCIDLSPYSPDLNITENVWNDMARRVEQRPASTMEALQDIVAEEWAATSIEFIQTLVSSMPARCQAVIEANGDHTKF
jgi:hypothetical protein